MSAMLHTQSFQKTFLTCQKKAELRYHRGLVPIAEEHALFFGDLVHGGLEAHFTGRDPFEAIRAKRADAHTTIYASAMLAGYRACYATESFEVVDVERAFRVDIAGYDCGGKWDAIVRRPNGLWVMEHKTAARIDAAYLERLWVDYQIAWYSAVAEHVYGEPIVGVIYDVIEKLPKAEAAKREPETDAEWTERQAAAKQPSRLKRRLGESDAEYAERMHAAYANPKRFHREEILLDHADLTRAVDEMRDVAFQWEEARRRAVFPRNTSQCFTWGKPCAYLPICSSRENPVLIEARYRFEDPNRELPADQPEALAF